MAIFSSRRKAGSDGAKRVRADSETAARDTTGDGATSHLSAAAASDVSLRNLPAAANLPDRIAISSATYAALQPCADTSVHEVVTSGPRPHVFAATMTSEPTAHGGEFLRRHLHKELQSQIIALNGDVLSAFKTTLAHLDLKFRALHIYNSHVLDGTHIAAAYVDLSSAAPRLYLASNGACRAVVVTRDALGRSLVSLEVGTPAEALAAQQAQQAAQKSEPQQPAAQQPRQLPRAGPGLHDSGGRLANEGLASMELTGDVESIILGSRGLWHELPVHQAALRVATAACVAPHATGGNLAAGLAQIALQNVATRVSKLKDPRMAALRDAATLQQLWQGSKRNYKWGGRQPLRRRRGDVHADLTAVVLRFDWSGSTSLPRSSLVCKKMCAAAAAGGSSMRALPRSSSGASIASASSFGALRTLGKASHWDAIRAHFLHFRPAASAAARTKWYVAVDAALAAAAAAKHAAAAPAPPSAEAVAQAPPAAPAGKAAAMRKSVDIRAEARPLDQLAVPAPLADAAPADEKAARRRALATTSYRRLTPSSARLMPVMEKPFEVPLQQLSVY